MLMRSYNTISRQSGLVYLVNQSLFRPHPFYKPTASLSNQAAAKSLRDLLDSELLGIKEAGTWKGERIITSEQSAEISVTTHKKTVLNFCANNYLGLSSHPEVVAEGKKMLDKYGAGLSSVRFICGTQDIHKALERKVARFHGFDDAILYTSCFDANTGLFEALLTPEDAILSDELNHASVIDGIRLCKAQRHRYKHRDMKDLEEKLKASAQCRMRLIATDGVFSMDGNIAPMKEICDLADRYNALVFVDESHSAGFFGKTGRGTMEYTGTEGRVHIVNSTLGKALGGASGGYTAGPQQLIDLLRNRSRPYLFSNSLPPAVVGCSSKALDLITHSSDLVEKLKRNTQLFRSRMSEAGFNVLGDKDHPICPVLLGDARLASSFSDKMLERGIFVIGFSYPVVPKGQARIRVQLSASHSVDNVNTAVDAFISIGKELNLIK